MECSTIDQLYMNSFEWCGYNWTGTMEGGRIMDSKNPWYWYSAATIVPGYKKGELKLNIEYNPKTIQYKGKTYNTIWECATMRSVEDFDFGIFSCEIVLPKGYHLWPSFWLSGSGNWPPEIDICEAWSGENDYLNQFTNHFPWLVKSWRVTSNVHYNNVDMKPCHVKSHDTMKCKQKFDPSSDWVKYECEWRKNSIVFRVNGKTVRKIGKRHSNMLISNIKDKDKGYRMNVIFNVWTDNPMLYCVDQRTSMKIRNFTYKPL